MKKTTISILCFLAISIALITSCKKESTTPDPQVKPIPEWIAINTGLSFGNGPVQSLYFFGNRLFAGVYGAGVYATDNSGNGWFSVNNGIPTYCQNSRSLLVNNTNYLYLLWE